MGAIKEITKQEFNEVKRKGGLKPPTCNSCGREAEIVIKLSKANKGKIMVCCRKCGYKKEVVIPTEWFRNGETLLSLETENSLATAISNVLNAWETTAVLDLDNIYTKQDFQREMNTLFAKAKHYGVFPNEDEKRQKEQEETELMEKTSEIYLSIIEEVDEGRKMVEQIKANGYDLKFSTINGNKFYDDKVIIKVSSNNPDDLPQEEVSNIIELMDKFISYHNQYNRLKEIYSGHWLADNPYFMGVFEYVAAKEYCKGSSYIKIEDVKRLMLMSGIFMWEAGLHCAENSPTDCEV